MATDETGFDDEFAEELIVDLEAFLKGALVRCYTCARFGPVELIRQESVKLPGDEHYRELDICNGCWLEQRVCEFCGSEGQDGEIAQISTKPKEPHNLYDFWICYVCLKS